MQASGRNKSASTALNPRRAALEICLQLLQQRQSLTALLELFNPRLANPQDRAFCHQLCYGFCRYYLVLRQTLAGLLSKPVKARDLDVEVILLLGLYQIRFTRVGDHAAVNETVNLLNQRKKSWARGLVNAVLRSYIREAQQAGQEHAGQLSDLEHVQCYPDWIRHKIERDWPQQAKQVLMAGNQHPPMVLRVDISSRSRQQYRQLLTRQGINSEPHPCVESALVLPQAVAVEALPGFDQGWVSVQDGAAQLAAGLLDAEPGMRVLDACAAPGGKTLHILQQTREIELIALDRDGGRLQRVLQNLQRGGVQAQTICADAAETDLWFDGHQFDRILLDAPCSASGIVRRHPDIRLLRQEDDIPALVLQQKRLLQAMWQLVKPGGQLLYSTCSIFKDENEEQIASFLDSCRNGVELPINHVQWGNPRPYGRQILPGDDNMDGFYYARLVKQN